MRVPLNKKRLNYRIEYFLHGIVRCKECMFSIPVRKLFACAIMPIEDNKVNGVGTCNSARRVKDADV